MRLQIETTYNLLDTLEQRWNRRKKINKIYIFFFLLIFGKFMYVIQEDGWYVFLCMYTLIHKKIYPKFINPLDFIHIIIIIIITTLLIIIIIIHISKSHKNRKKETFSHFLAFYSFSTDYKHFFTNIFIKIFHKFSLF